MPCVVNRVCNFCMVHFAEVEQSVSSHLECTSASTKSVLPWIGPPLSMWLGCATPIPWYLGWWFLRFLVLWAIFKISLSIPGHQTRLLARFFMCDILGWQLFKGFASSYSWNDNPATPQNTSNLDGEFISLPVEYLLSLNKHWSGLWSEWISNFRPRR